MEIVCSNNLFINDARSINQFKEILFGGYKKKDVISQIEKKILLEKVESSCYLAYQLLVSGELNLLWDKLCSILYKNIKNHKLIKWLYYKNKIIINLLNNYSKTKQKINNILDLRNSQLIRNIITEFILLLSYSSKKEKLYLLNKKPNKDTDFLVENFNNLLKNKNNIVINDIITDNDGIECKYVINELVINLLNKNLQAAMYWIEWLLIWEKINIKKFKKFKVQTREINQIDNKYHNDIIWLIWSAIFYVKNKINDKLQLFYGYQNYKILDDTLNYIWLLYISNWKPSLKQKKQILVYLYLNYLINPQDMTINIIDNSYSQKYLVMNLLIQDKLFTKIKHQSFI